MGQFETKYSDDQRRAVEYAALDAGIKPLTEIARLARAGELVLKGVALAPFEIPDASVRDIVAREKKRREGRQLTHLAQQPHETAVDLLRKRLVSLLDSETLRMEEHQRKHPKDVLDAEQARKCGRALRELASLPEPGERGRQPGAHVPGEGLPAGEGVAKPNTMRGQMMAALNAGAPGGRTAQSDPLPQETGQGDVGVGGDAARDAATRNVEDGAREREDGDPGAYARSALAGLTASHVDGVPLR